eukprot:8366540-Alexandrium_andersonii.AAC.1
MTPNPLDEASEGEMFMLCSASERVLRITDCALITDCRRIRRSTGLPDYGLFEGLGSCQQRV